MSAYDVYENGELTSVTPADVKDFEWSDIVSFYLGCSFSFDHLLENSGIKLPSSVPIYQSNIDCVSAGPFKAKLEVSMRPIAVTQLQKAVECTINCDYAHGAPIHIGCPKDIGIDLNKFMFGGLDEILENEVPVFWACGNTSCSAVQAASKVSML